MKQEQNNFNQHKQSSNINNSINIENKNYTYCIKCGVRFTTPSPTPFCDWDCRREYYQEIKKENDALFGEWIGRD